MELLLLFCVLTGISEIAGKYNAEETKPNLSQAELQSYLTHLLSQNESLRSCPAPAFPVSDKDCQAQTCVNEGSCQSKNQSCCFNGCVFTCVQRISPPPVIDWEGEPEASVLKTDGAAVLHCTTSPRPAPSVPVGCPTGYVCKIEDFGDPFKGGTNRGICVPLSEAEKPPEVFSVYKENTRKETVYLPGGCILTDTQYKHMQDFMTRSYVVDCFCLQGSVECQVSL